MSKNQNRKIAIVTGAAKGLGKEIALFFAKEGFTVAVHYHRSIRDANLLLAQIKKYSSDSRIFSADLTKQKEVDKFSRKVVGKYGRVDVLVNNVGNFIYKKFPDLTNNEFIDSIESNIYATLFTSRAFLPVMRKAKSGNIINIGAVGAERIQLRGKSTHYFLAKTGVYILTKAMAWEEARYGVRINMISPASMKTDIFGNDDFPMGRSARYGDVVKALKFLISAKAQYINGANIEVAGAFIPGFE